MFDFNAPIDQDAVKLSKAIRQIETPGGKPVAGASGELPSRYQWTPGTWKSVAKQFLGDENAPINNENENKAMYARVKTWKDQGYKPYEIAAMHNAGEGRPDAWKDNVGVNKYGVKYDTPAYVSKVKAAYLSQQTNQPQVNAQPSIEDKEVSNKPLISKDSAAYKELPTKQKSTLSYLPETIGETLLDFGKGVLKGAGSTLASTSTLGEKMLSLGKAKNTLGEQIIKSGITTPTNLAQKLGVGTEKTAEFLLPGGVASKAETALARGAIKAIPELTGEGLARAAGRGIIKTGTRAAIEAPLLAGQTAMQGGNAKDIKTAAITGAAFPVVGGVLKGAQELIGKNTAGRIINSLIKPRGIDFAYGKDPGMGVAREGIVANTLEDLENKISAKRKDIGEAIGRVLTKPENSKKFIDISKEFKPLDDALEKALKNPRSNRQIISRLEDAKKDLLGIKILPDGTEVATQKMIVNPEEAFKIKQQIADITKFTGAMSDDKAVNMALKKIYGGIKKKIGDAVPETISLNERYADLSSAEVATRNRDILNQRQNIIRLGGRLAGIGSILAFLSTGNPATLLGLGVEGITEALGTTAAKTRIAKLLYGMSEAEKEALLSKSPVLKQTLDRVFGVDIKSELPPAKFLPPEVKPKIAGLLGRGPMITPPPADTSRSLTQKEIEAYYQSMGHVPANTRRGLLNAGPIITPPPADVSRSLTQEEAVEYLKSLGHLPTEATPNVSKTSSVKLPIITAEIIGKKQQIQILKETLANDPARLLTRYTVNGRLPEVTGKGRSLYARTGDQIAQELGFEDSNAAALAFEKYKSKLLKLKQIQNSQSFEKELPEF